ncbi:fasciclin domain-containing protein [Bacteroidota bacterium]
MNIRGFLFTIIIISFLSACEDKWGEHYEKLESSVNVKLWDTLKTMSEYSEFMSFMEFYNLDTFMQSSHSKTLFIPANQAFEMDADDDTTGYKEIIKYHMISSFFMIRNVEDKIRIQTMAKKFALVEFDGSDNTFYFDGVKINKSSPLFKDGKFYEIDRIAFPKPNLYQYLQRNNIAVVNYIDTQDTVILDLNKSTPIGYNEFGQTIYDSVTTTENIYEMEYFAISEEFRDITATLIIPDSATYNGALTEMALILGGTFTSWQDIPVKWQNEVLIPILLEKGTYAGMLSPEDFNVEKKINARGDTMVIDFEVDSGSRVICSNGLVYDYSSFIVDENLYLEKHIEAEDLVDSLTRTQDAWINDTSLVKIEGDRSKQPSQQLVAGASNDTAVNVDFGLNFKGEYSATFTFKNIFPFAVNYRFVWRTSYLSTGVYSIYVNGEKVLIGLEKLEEFDTFNLVEGFYSILGYKIYPDMGFCILDASVDNITEFGDVKIKLEYRGPGQSGSNGLFIDYMALIPK